MNMRVMDGVKFGIGLFIAKELTTIAGDVIGIYAFRNSLGFRGYLEREHPKEYEKLLRQEQSMKQADGN